MNRLSLSIRRAALPVLAISTFFSAPPAAADSIMRLIGDRATKSPIQSSETTTVEPPASAAAGRSTIRLIGDKPSAAVTPRQQPDAGSAASTANGIRIIGDKTEPVQKKTIDQPDAGTIAENEQKAKMAADAERALKETAEQMTAQRLADIKAEEERKVAEKAEQERLAQIKVTQENEAARQIAIQKEQEQLAARIAEESRKIAEKTEQERIAKEKNDRESAAAEAARHAAIQQEQEMLAAREAEESRQATAKEEQKRNAILKAEKERIAAEQKTLVDKIREEREIQAHQPEQVTPSVDSPTVAIENKINLEIKTDRTSLLPPETIWDLYLSAKVNDPTLRRTEARVTGSKAESDLLFSGLLPHVSSRVGAQQISQTLNNYSEQQTKNDYSSFNYNVSASLTLLSIPTLYSLSAAAASLSGEQAGVTAARQNLIVKFTDSYFSLLKAQVDKQIAEGEIHRLTRVLDQSQAFLKAGTGDIIAVYEAQSRLDGATADLTKSESTLRLAEQRLSTVVGKPVSAIVNYLPQTPAGPEPDSLDWWVATMEKEQPIVRQAREGLNQTAEQRKAVKAEYLPTLQATGGYDVNRGTAALPTAEVRQWFVGATLSLPLYSGGETSAKVRRAVATEEERQHAFDETMDQQRENVKQAFFNLRYNISLIKAQEQRRVSAEIQLAAVSKGRKIGTRNAIDQLNAEQTYSIALRDYKYALYDNFIRVIQLKSAAGILVESDISEISHAVAPLLISSYQPAFR